MEARCTSSVRDTEIIITITIIIKTTTIKIFLPIYFQIVKRSITALILYISL